MQSPTRSDLLIAGLVTLVAQLETWTSRGYEPRGAYAVAALAMTVPLAWRRAAPLAVLAAVFVPLGAMIIAGHPLDSTYVMLVLLLAFHATGAYCERRRAIAGLALGLGGLASSGALEAVLADAGERAPGAGDFVFLAAILGAVWTLAVSLRDRALHAGRMQARADRLERERELRAREAVADERARIARELHDVVAHSISVIAIQTGSLRRRLRHERPADAEELSRVEETAREALAEMRRLLGLLRSEGESATLSPQPGLEQLERLADQLRRTGMAVEVEVQGDPRPLPPGIDLAAYRVIQEGLTNALKHAGPARTHVCVRYGARELELEVIDDGRGPGDETNGAGHGLVGMRERVSLYGGTLHAGPADGRGFAVRVRLPIAAP